MSTCHVRAVYLSNFFFFQAEDGIRDYKVTGVQTCALPISLGAGADADAGVPRPPGVAAPVPDSPVPGGGEELPDREHRLHRRPPPQRGARGGAGTQAHREAPREREGHPPRRHEVLIGSVGGLRFLNSSRVMRPLSTHSSARVRSTSAPFSIEARSASSVDISASRRSSRAMGPRRVSGVSSSSSVNGGATLSLFCGGGVAARRSIWPPRGVVGGTSTPSCFAMRGKGLLSIASATFTTSKGVPSSSLPISMAASFSLCTSSAWVLAVPAA